MGEEQLTIATRPSTDVYPMVSPRGVANVLRIPALKFATSTGAIVVECDSESLGSGLRGARNGRDKYHSRSNPHGRNGGCSQIL